MGTNAYKIKNHINIQPQNSAPSNPVLGDIYCNASGDFFRYDGETWTGIGGGGEGISIGVAQIGHGFAQDGSAIGTPIRSQGTADTYVAAKADTDANAEVVGFITAVNGDDDFTYAPAGLISGLTGRTVGAVYFLSADTAGVVTTTEPSTVGQISKPCYVAISETEAVILNMRGTTVGGTNLYTTIPLNNGAATTIQSLAGATFPNGTGGFIEGFIKIDATTDYTFTFKVEWSKDIAGTTYHVTPTLGAGDVPAGFSISNSGANIQVTLPSVAGFSSASATFSMQAAAIGTTLPLQIDSALITQNAVGNGLNPTGAVIPFAGSSAPTGYLLCDGTAVSRTTYAALFAVLSTTFGSGDGSTTFNLPDMRETIPVGVGTRGAGVTAHDTYTLGQFKDDQAQGHRHDALYNAFNSNQTFTSGSSSAVLQGVASTPDTDFAYTQVTDGTNGTPRTGTTTHGKQMGLNYIIKT